MQTFAEFKAWFQGYSEAIGECPSAEQWARIKQQVGALPGPLSPRLGQSTIPNPYAARSLLDGLSPQPIGPQSIGQLQTGLSTMGG